MTVYVDDHRSPMGRRLGTCHLVADTTEELTAFAESIGVSAEFLRNGGSHREHFQICRGTRDRALANGAAKITRTDLERMLFAKKHSVDEPCSVCGEPKFQTVHGDVCKNGHGGA